MLVSEDFGASPPCCLTVGLLDKIGVMPNPKPKIIYLHAYK